MPDALLTWSPTVPPLLAPGTVPGLAPSPPAPGQVGAFLPAASGPLRTTRARYRSIDHVLAEMHRLIGAYRVEPWVRRLAVAIAADLPDLTERRELAAALLAWVRSEVRFAPDPPRVELLMAPDVLLGVGAGDCDDLVVLFCALAESLGVPTRLVIVGYDDALTGDDAWQHVYAEVDMGPDLNGPAPRPRWIAADPTIPGGLGAVVRGVRRRRVSAAPPLTEPPSLMQTLPVPPSSTHDGFSIGAGLGCSSCQAGPAQGAGLGCPDCGGSCGDHARSSNGLGAPPCSFLDFLRTLFGSSEAWGSPGHEPHEVVDPAPDPAGGLDCLVPPCPGSGDTGRDECPEGGRCADPDWTPPGGGTINCITWPCPGDRQWEAWAEANPEAAAAMMAHPLMGSAGLGNPFFGGGSPFGGGGQINLGGLNLGFGGSGDPFNLGSGFDFGGGFGSGFNLGSGIPGVPGTGDFGPGGALGFDWLGSGEGQDGGGGIPGWLQGLIGVLGAAAPIIIALFGGDRTGPMSQGVIYPTSPTQQPPPGYVTVTNPQTGERAFVPEHLAAQYAQQYGGSTGSGTLGGGLLNWLLIGGVAFGGYKLLTRKKK